MHHFSSVLAIELGACFLNSACAYKSLSQSRSWQLKKVQILILLKHLKKGASVCELHDLSKSTSKFLEVSQFMVFSVKITSLIQINAQLLDICKLISPKSVNNVLF